MFLVRHARPIVDPSQPPAEWALSQEGTDAASHLGRLLGTAATVVSSTEAKAIATAAALDLGEVTVDAALGEVSRPWYEDGKLLRRDVETWFAGDDVEGWESRATAVERFNQALRQAEPEGLVVVTHGTVMTAWLQEFGAVSNALRFWTNLRQPDAWRVDLSRGAVTPVR